MISFYAKSSLTFDLLIREPIVSIVFVVQWNMWVEFVFCKAKDSQNIEQESLDIKSMTRVF